MKNSNDTIGNQTRDLPACSVVPQPTAPPAACPQYLMVRKYIPAATVYRKVTVFEQTGNLSQSPAILK